MTHTDYNRLITLSDIGIDIDLDILWLRNYINEIFSDLEEKMPDFYYDKDNNLVLEDNDAYLVFHGNKSNIHIYGLCRTLKIDEDTLSLIITNYINKEYKIKCNDKYIINFIII